MKIEFEKVAPPYPHPISSRELKALIVASDLAATAKKIAKIHFGCNQKTSQEARIVIRGDTYEIRINFCLKDGKTRLLSDRRPWCEIVECFGGIIDGQNREVTWTKEATKGYVVFLLFHELAHILYSERNQRFILPNSKGSPSEESWCDNYAKTVASRVLAVCTGTESEKNDGE